LKAGDPGLRFGNLTLKTPYPTPSFKAWIAVDSVVRCGSLTNK
jgi:hypothetical protein